MIGLGGLLVVTPLIGATYQWVATRHDSRQLTIPVMVVTAGRGADAEWRSLQADQVGLSQRGCQVVAEESGHVVAVDQPQVGVEAIRATVSAARGNDVLPCGSPGGPADASRPD